MVGAEGLQGVQQRVRHLRDVLGLLGRQLVEVLVDRLVRLDAVLDAVQARHHLRREGEVRVARSVRRAELDALGLGVRARDRDADGGGAVARRVDQVDGRLVALDQALVRVQRRVGEGENRGGVSEQTADVPAGDVRQAAVALLVVEEGLALEPQRLVRVHARAVVTEEGLGHKGRDLAPLLGDVLDDVLELQDVVGRVHHRVEAVVDLLLAAGAHLVVRALEDEAGLDQVQRDVVAEVGRLVDGRDGEVAALVRGLVGEVPALFDAAGVPGAFLGVDGVERGVLLHLVAHVVEDVELRLGGEESRVGDAGRREVLLGLLGDLARVLGVDLAVARVVDVEEHDERLRLAERVEVGGGDIRDELHVGLVDVREAADRRTVEQLTDREELLVDCRGGDVEVLLHTRQIRETDVEELDVLVLDVLEHLG